MHASMPHHNTAQQQYLCVPSLNSGHWRMHTQDNNQPWLMNVSSLSLSEKRTEKNVLWEGRLDRPA
jgi:hypothetical protein